MSHPRIVRFQSVTAPSTIAPGPRQAPARAALYAALDLRRRRAQIAARRALATAEPAGATAPRSRVA